MQSRIVLALGSRARGDDPKAVSFKQNAKNVTKSLVVLDQKDHMHRIGHFDILNDHGTNTYTFWYFAGPAVATERRPARRTSELLGELDERPTARPVLGRKLADAGAATQKIDAIE